MLINNLPFLQSMISIMRPNGLIGHFCTIKNANNNDEGEYYAQKQDSFG